MTISAGAAGSDVTNASGEYTIAGLAPGSYTLTASLPQWSFDPPTRQVEVVDQDASGEDFVGTPLCTTPLVDVRISGPTEGITGTLYAFTAEVSPTGATQPITYTWSPAPASGQGTAGTEYLWSTPAVYSVSLEAENCGGQAEADHTLLIGAGAAQSIEPEQGGTLVYTDALGSPTVIQVPSGAVTGTVTLVFQPQGEAVPPPGMASAGHAFSLDAYRGGDRLPGLQFEKALTVTIVYSDTEMAGLYEDSLGLWFWNGAAWSTEGISVTALNSAANQLEATVSHLSQFAVFGDRKWRVFLPLLTRVE